MRIDISKTIDAVAPWDLSITCDGKDFPTKRPTIGLIARLQAMASLPKEQMLPLVQEIFQGDGPDLSTWAHEAMFGAMSAYMAYFNRESLKNSRAIAASVTAEMATPATAAT